MPELAIQDAITLPGCKLMRSGLEIDQGLSDDELNGIGQTLNNMSECGLWWWGDYLCHLKKERGDNQATNAEETGYQPGTLRVAKWVCSHIPLLSRDNAVTYTHHREALLECDSNVGEALGWITQARENKWTVADMRKAIRQAKSTHEPEANPDHDKGQPGIYDHVKELLRWSRTELETATPELKAELKRDLLKIIELL